MFIFNSISQDVFNSAVVYWLNAGDHVAKCRPYIGTKSAKLSFSMALARCTSNCTVNVWADNRWVDRTGVAYLGVQAGLVNHYLVCVPFLVRAPNYLSLVVLLLSLQAYGSLTMFLVCPSCYRDLHKVRAWVWSICLAFVQQWTCNGWCYGCL